MFTDRLLRINPSPTVNLLTKEAIMEKKGIDLISFAAGEPDFTTPQFIIDEAYKAMVEGKTHYTPSNGIEPLRTAISEKYKSENNVNINADNVLVTPSKYALFMAVMAHVSNGDEVLVPDPGWVSYPDMVKLSGGEPVPYMLDEVHDYALSHESVKNKISKNTKMIIINSPSNPTGALLSREDLKFLNDIAEDYNIFVLADEVYEKIIYEGTHISIGSIDTTLEHTLIVNSFSKAYAMTGWRIGYLIANKENIQQIEKMQQQTITCASSFAQYAAVKAIHNSQSVYDMVREFQKRRDKLVKLLGAIDIFRFSVPKSTFYMFPRVNYKNMNDMQFSEFLLNVAHVSVTPGSAFGSLGKNHIRISFATSMENIEKGIERIKNVL